MVKRGRGLPAKLRIVALAVIGLFVLSACDYYDLAVYIEKNNPSSRPWWCDSTGGGHGDHVMDPDPYAGVVKGVLSWDDCKANSQWFDEAKAYALQWPTAGEAEDDGFHQVVGFADGMGTHHARLNELIGGFDDVFDPGRPEYLMYDGNGRNARLTGMAWWVESTDGPPAGFAGDNDWWHQHPGVCLTQQLTWIGQGYTQQECQAIGGIYANTDDFWMVHAWILDDWKIQFDVFQNHHPCLIGGVHSDPDDPCWDEAMHGSHMSH